LIPFHAESGFFYASVPFNSSGDGDDGVTGVVLYDRDFDTTNGPVALANTNVYARFTPSAAAVPEPMTWAMMLLGFGGIGMAMRRRRHVVANAS
jgi:hypothetical protein